MQIRMNQRWLAVAAAGAVVSVAGGLTVLNPPESAHGTPPTATPAPTTTSKPKVTVKPAAKPAETTANMRPNLGSEPRTPKETTPAAKTEPADDEHGTKTDDGRGTQMIELTPAKPKAEPSESLSGEIDAQAALKLLRDGNARWVAAQNDNPNTDKGRRADVAAAGQHPFATILTCADSRVPVEYIFDRGVGDLFVLRVAGNVINTDGAGTIEYGAEHLHSKLLVVMGHTKCGAVQATVQGAKVEGNIAALVEHIKPAADRASKDSDGKKPEEVVAAAVKENVWQSVFDLLRTSPETCRLVKSGELKVVGAVYDIASGKVEWLGEHPWQEELVDAFILRSQQRNEAHASADGHDAEPAATAH